LFFGKPKKRIKQLFSVFTGYLTIVGIYPSNIDTVKYKRGITGLAAISSPERLSDITIAKLNDYYINNYSFLLDLEIILKHLIRKKSGR
jgi:lipopolysaccharide/colanic/teichoic acid biosynthesis glycosyltransferase